jgi:hypothetical protein
MSWLVLHPAGSVDTEGLENPNCRSNIFRVQAPRQNQGQGRLLLARGEDGRFQTGSGSAKMARDECIEQQCINGPGTLQLLNFRQQLRQSIAGGPQSSDQQRLRQQSADLTHLLNCFVTVQLHGIQTDTMHCVSDVRRLGVHENSHNQTALSPLWTAGCLL